jgi:predicted Zn-dependent protease
MEIKMKKLLSFILILFGSIFITTTSADAVFSNPTSIRVYVESHQSSSVADEAMKAWTSATKGHIKFVKAKKPEEVQIYVRFVKNIGKNTGSNTIGLTHHMYANGRQLELIEISEKAPNGRLFSHDARLRVMIHEFGHALGLNHTNDPKSVMYPTKGVKTISSDDVRTLQYLYGWE